MLFWAWLVCLFACFMFLFCFCFSCLSPGKIQVYCRMINTTWEAYIHLPYKPRSMKDRPMSHFVKAIHVCWRSPILEPIHKNRHNRINHGIPVFRSNFISDKMFMDNLFSLPNHCDSFYSFSYHSIYSTHIWYHTHTHTFDAKKLPLSSALASWKSACAASFPGGTISISWDLIF